MVNTRASLSALEAVARGGSPAPLSEEDLARIGRARRVVEAKLDEGAPVYGVNTGFGSLANVSIAPADTAQLQVNLVRSHAVGSGPPLARDVVRGMLALLRASL
ncbi:MAG: aromatic amino acid lyase, partial [Solirubrobacteraceae bacterium]